MISETSEWLKLKESLGTPVNLELAVVATRLQEKEKPSGLHLELWLEKEQMKRHAWAYSGEWYPGRPTSIYSHYFGTLKGIFDGLRAQKREEKVRLHVLNAVAVQPPDFKHPAIYLLKFIVSPEVAIEGSQLETVYQCPLKAFFEGFIGLSPDPLEKSESVSAVAGKAVHRGYQWVSRAHHQNGGGPLPQAQYRSALLRTWEEDFVMLLRKPIDPKRGPVADHSLPLRAELSVLQRCAERLSSVPEALYHERLFYSPQRGLSGKVDQLLMLDGRQELSEIKTSGGHLMESDPETGEAAPGGIQALTYHEALRTCGGDETRPTRTHVEVFESKSILASTDFRAVELSRHPLLTRIRVPLNPGDPRYIDLLAQNRNVGYAAESGLLTGYDRTKIDALLKQGRRLRGVGGSFEYYGSRPPCSFCPAQRRGICEDATRYDANPPMHGFFRHVPDELFEYWAWYHRQLSRDLQAVKRHLHRLASTPLTQLETVEGISIGHLMLQAQDERVLLLAREEPFETRLRAGDRVLLSAGDGRPGDLFSVQATVTELKRNTLALELSDPGLPDAPHYRIDQFEQIYLSRWQVQGLTDFLVSSMIASPAQGRKREVAELPLLARILLGDARPVIPTAEDVSHLADELNPLQREAIGRALALPEESLMLLQGPPGTGKTKTVAYLARELLLRHFWDADRKPVLILTNTHRAANEVIRKLNELFPDLKPYILRVGRPTDAWEAEVAQYSLLHAAGAKELLAQYDFSPPMREIGMAIRHGLLHLKHAGIFVGTLGSANAEELKGLTFAYTLVDEAGQSTEPGTLQALRHMEPGYRGRFILIGDHCQLPPVVKEAEESDPLPDVLLKAGLREGETLKTSLFERLTRLYPDALLTLKEQYRMNAPICRLISETFYGGALLPGSPAVARATLRTWYERLGAEPTLSGWIAAALDPDVPILFLDTSNDPAARDSSISLGGEESRDNGREAILLSRLLSAWMNALPPGIRRAASDGAGVVSPYRRQNNRIRQELDDLGPEELAHLRVDTVDRFQGGEKPLLCVSLVSSNASGSIGKLHEDWRRMNVALSRAQHKLILIGDRRTFTADSGLGSPAEEGAREAYRRLFGVLDQLVDEGAARVIRTELLGNGSG